MLFQISQDEIKEYLQLIPVIHKLNSFQFVNNTIEFNMAFQVPDKQGLPFTLLSLVKKVGLLNVKGTFNIAYTPQTDTISVEVKVKNFVQSNILTILGISNKKIDMLEFKSGDKVLIHLNKIKQLQQNDVKISVNSIVQDDSLLSINFNMLI